MCSDRRSVVSRVTVLVDQEGSGDESRFGPNQRACQPSLLIEERRRDRVF
ncbi:hypothetical protein HanRHA438_Chr04g0159111 [Helianthus annuus]|nr:hypothetical protein HanIR_Chr04g0160141 [Helianthus annuus]KAJ0925378.1 hypothetical protein HanRHA438_Chr04g0159111 [Helianthus annuus]